SISIRPTGMPARRAARRMRETVLCLRMSLDVGIRFLPRGCRLGGSPNLIFCEMWVPSINILIFVRRARDAVEKQEMLLKSLKGHPTPQNVPIFLVGGFSSGPSKPPDRSQ